MDPFIIAQANQVVEQANSALAQSRDKLRHEAIQYVERVQGETRAEAIQVLNQIQTEANRAIDESHTQVAQSQRKLNATRVEATKDLNRASLELESIRNQCSFEVESLKAQAKAEYMSFKAEAQKQVSILEGKVGELIHVNSQFQDRLIAQTKESERLLKLLTEKEGAYESLLHQIQNQEIDEIEPQTARPTSEEAGNGAGFFQIFIPVGRHSQPGPGSRGFMLDADQSHAQDAMLGEKPSRSTKAGVKPSSSSMPDAKPSGSIQLLGRFQKGYNSNEQVPKKSKGEKKSKLSQQYDTIMNQLPSLVEQIKSASRSLSRKASSSGSSSSSSSPKGGGSPGDSPVGSNISNRSSSSSQDEEKDPYRMEKKLMRVKGCDSIKIASIPKNAAECRGFKNQVVSAICKTCKGDETPLVAWIQKCSSVKDPTEFASVGNYPALDRTLGHKLLANARGTRFSLDFQALQEKCQKEGKKSSGRLLLWFILNKFNLDKDRGASLNQHHLLSLKLSGKDLKSLEEFRQKLYYIIGSLEQSEMPQESALRSMLYENLKHHPLLALAIDKYRASKGSSSKRIAQWLIDRLEAAIELYQQDENTSFVEKALQTTGGHKMPKIQKGNSGQRKERNKDQERTTRQESRKGTKGQGQKGLQKWYGKSHCHCCPWNF